MRRMINFVWIKFINMYKNFKFILKALRRIQKRSSFPNPSSPLFSSSPSSPWTHLRSALVLVTSSSPASSSSSSNPWVSSIHLSINASLFAVDCLLDEFLIKNYKCLCLIIYFIKWLYLMHQTCNLLWLEPNLLVVLLYRHVLFFLLHG